MSRSIFSGDHKLAYFPTAGANKVIKASAGFLKAIIVGEAVSTSTIEVSDSPSDGDGAVKIFLSGDALGPRIYEVNAYFETGICADISNQTKVTFVYS